MKKSKIIALTMAISMFGSLVTGNISASAAVTNAGDVNAGFVLTYDAENSDETTRYIKVDAVGAPKDLQAVTLFVVFSGDDFGADSSVKIEMPDLPMADVNAPSTNKATYTASKGGWQYKLTWTSGADADACYSDSYIGTFKITLPSNSAFNAEVVKVKLANTADKTTQVGTGTEAIKADCHAITVPAFATTPVDPVPDEVETARKDFTSYDDADVTTFIAGEKSIADVAGKTLTWKITSKDGGYFEKAANVDTDLNGAGNVVFGLMIVNDDAEDFAKIDKAVLVIK